jgi:hypothetical protein
MRYQTTRRGALKAGLLGAGAFALNYPSARSDDLPASPTTTPFLDPLPIARLASNDDRDDDDEQYEARSAATRGDATALRYILRNVKEKYSGDVVHVGLKRRSHRLVYQIKLIDPTGKMLLLRVDAKSGAILGEHGS